MGILDFVFLSANLFCGTLKGASVVLFPAYLSWVQHLNKYSTYIYPSICAKKKNCFPGLADRMTLNSQ